MIITLKGADFSASNIGKLNSWRVFRYLDAGATYSGPFTISKDGDLSFSATVTIRDGYELAEAGLVVTMGEVPVTGIDTTTNPINIAIEKVIGDIAIKVTTVSIGGGDVPEEVILDYISVAYNQGQTTIFESQEIDDLKHYLTVTGHYSDGATEEFKEYTLTGPLQAGESTITVSAQEKTTTFTVDVTEFTLPTGYTRYGYIQTKSNSTKTVVLPLTKYIFLSLPKNSNDPALDPLHPQRLSYEFTIGAKNSTIVKASGCLGVRGPAGAADKNYVGVYWPENSLNIYCRQTVASFAQPNSGKHKIVIENAETSPVYCYVDHTNSIAKDWVEDQINYFNNREICLFNNRVEGDDQDLNIHTGIRIGDVIARKNTGECVAYFTPCTKEINGAKYIGMYDQIAKEFYTTSDTAATTVGNANVVYQVGNW